MRFFGLVVLAALGCTTTEDVRLVTELPPGISTSEARGVEMSLARGRCGSAEIAWTTAFRPGEGGDAPPVLEGGAYSASAAALDANCLVFAEGCVTVELPLGEDELVVPTSPVDPPRAACPPWQCSDGVCARDACGIGADEDVVALFEMEEGPDGPLVDSISGSEHAFEAPPQPAEGPDGCGLALAPAPGGVALVPGDSTLTLGEGAIDLFVWLPAEIPPVTSVSVFRRDLRVGGPLDPFGLIWAPDGRLIVRAGTITDGIPGRGVCATEPVDRERWVHVGINLGPPGVELWIDGVRQVGDGRFEKINGGQPGECESGGTGTSATFPAAMAPWVIGGSAEYDDAGTITGYESFYGRLDQLRFTARRRDFSGFAGIVP